MKRKLLLIVASLLLSGSIFAQDFHWSGFDYHAYTGPMTVIARVYLDGVRQNRSDIEVANFVGTELRGTKFTFEPYPAYPEVGYYVYAACYYNTPGETFTFKAYDHAAGIEYDLCPTELIGQDGGHGTVENPIDLYFTTSTVPFVGPTYPWTPATSFSGEGMVVTAQIKINGELVTSANWELGAFCGDECRAICDGLDDWTDVDLGYFAFMNVMGEDGDEISFYLYDKDNSQILEAVCYTTITMQNGGEVGIDIFGGDIFVLDFLTKSTFTKEIKAYTANGGYYLIATPIGEVDPIQVENMLSNSYDLYYFDQSKDLEWINYKAGNFNLTPGKGYLYANSSTVMLSFVGWPHSSADTTLTLTKASGAAWAGWNLVGNPFPVKAYPMDANNEPMPFYTMKSDGSEIILEEETNSVKAMQGIFVLAENDGETMTFTTTAPAKANHQIVVNVSQNSDIVDRAIVRLDEEKGLTKFQIRENSTKVYIPQNGKDYALVKAESEDVVPVHFKAEKNGTYTISISTEGLDVDYMHLIDNMTGADVDLLQSSTYSFEAKTTDYESRFKLVFSTNANGHGEGLVFISDGHIIVNNADANTVLQVVDMLGRILVQGNATDQISTENMTPGVYVVRLLNGENSTSEKIVVK